MSSVLTIGGSAVSGPRLILSKLHLRLKGVDTLTFQVRGGPVVNPDPFVGKTVTLTIGGTLRFSGDVTRSDPDPNTPLGYVTTYQCLGLRNRGDWIPITDSNTGTDTAAYNISLENQAAYIASRAGRTVGQIITDILMMEFNSGNLAYWGIGGYSGTWPSITLPASTVSDLAALTLIPPHEVYIQGERLLTAIDGFLSNDAPNVALYVQPDGTMRFLDARTFSNHVFTLGTDPVEPVGFSHDTGECFSRIEVRGQPNTVAVVVTLSEGTLVEDFAHDGLSNSAAKAAWVPSDFSQPGQAQDQGSCTCPTTTTVTVTSASGTTNWPSDFWDQTSSGAQGVVYLLSSSLGGLITQQTSRKIVSNTALTGGGSSTLTLDYPLADTSYDSYWIHGNIGGSSLVYRKYKVNNAALGAAMARLFNYPVAFTSSAGNNAELVSTPTASICYSVSGSPPYTEEPLQFDIDPSTGHIYTYKPTSLVFGGGSTTTPASDVRVLLAINQGPNHVYAPVNDPTTGDPQYEGTFFTADLASDTTRAKTGVVTCSDWRDPAGQGALQAFAQDILDSCKDATYEGTITYYGLFTSALTFGLAVTVTGAGYTTGWETMSSFSGHPGLPVVEVELDYGDEAGASIYKTTLHCSNRRAHYSASEFLHPARSFVPIGFEAPTGFNSASSDFSQTAGADPTATQNPSSLMSDPSSLMGGISGPSNDSLLNPTQSDNSLQQAQGGN